MPDQVISIEIRRGEESRAGVTPWEVKVDMVIRTESATDAAMAVLESLRDLVDG